jgi:hypothetical protein
MGACRWGAQMSCRFRPVILFFLVLFTSSAARVAADEAQVQLVVAAGRPIRARLNKQITIKDIGQVIKATVIDPVYAYDRIVIPAGTTVTGYIAEFEVPSRWSRARTMLGGDFTPQRKPLVLFDKLTLPDGTGMSVATRAASGRERVVMSTTSAAEEKTGVIERGKQEAAEQTKAAIASAKQHMHDALSTVTAPDKMERLKEAAVNQLPYHPMYLHAGTVFTAELSEPVSFGSVAPTELASNEKPAPESVLNARLVTPLDSATTSKGTALEAVLTEPVFSPHHRLIYPEGTMLDGEVTFSKHAASWHRNGQLRFLIESVQLPDQESQTLLASLYGVETSQDDRIVVDDEGGASATNSKTRFIAPALAILSLHMLNDKEHRRFDNDGDDNQPVSGQSGLTGRNLAGWFGFGLIGVGLSHIAHPVSVGLGVYGAIRTTYSNIISKGHEVTFPTNTVLELQLAPSTKSEEPQ